MLQSFRQIKNRIRSIESTKKITRAMEMVAIAKLRPVENKLIASRAYALKIENMLKNLLPAIDQSTHPLTENRPDKGKIALCLITSDTGLCGIYNQNIIRAAENFIQQFGKDNVSLITVGRKGFNYFKRRDFKIAKSYLELNGRYSNEACREILKSLVDQFSSGEVNEVYAAYTYFVSFARQNIKIEKILNIDAGGEKNTDYIAEPQINSIVAKLIPEYLFNKMKIIFLNAFSCEHSARMISMGEATKNAKDLLDSLILLRNKVRQANITREIIEIVSSAEVLR